MDIGDTLAPKSDQLNFDDLIAGSRTVTIVGKQIFDPKTSQQPVWLELAEYPGRPYKPNKSMRRVLTMVWGSKSDLYVGRKLTLFGDPNVTFGPNKVGGIKISHMSHIDKPTTVRITIRQAVKGPYTVQPLVESAPVPQRDWHAEAVACTDEDALRALYMDAQAVGASSEVLAGIQGMAAMFASPQAPESPSEPSEQ